MAPATKQGINTALGEARAALARARTLLDELSESYAEDIAEVELGPHGQAHELRILSDAADMLREAGERMATADDDLENAIGLVGSA